MSKAQNSDMSVIIIILLFLCLVISTIYILRLRKKQNKTLMDLRDVNDWYYSILEKSKMLETGIVTLKQDKEKYIKEKEKELEDLRKKIRLYIEEAGNVSDLDANSEYLYSPIVLQMHKHATKCTQPSDEEWNKLRNMAEKAIPNFCRMIETKHIGLTDMEKLAALLVKLRFLPSELAVLLDLSPQSVTNLRSSINMKMFNQHGTKSLNFNIRSIN